MMILMILMIRGQSGIEDSQQIEPRTKGVRSGKTGENRDRHDVEISPRKPGQA
jgi:hypothetical protein